MLHRQRCSAALHIFPGDLHPRLPLEFSLHSAVSRAQGTPSMEDYKAYLLGPDGHITGRVDLVCVDEDTAKERAQQLALDCIVELYRGAQKIAEFDPQRS